MLGWEHPAIDERAVARAKIAKEDFRTIEMKFAVQSGQ
jgi:hypothetical protein